MRKKKQETFLLENTFYEKNITVAFLAISVYFIELLCKIVASSCLCASAGRFFHESNQCSSKIKNSQLIYTAYSLTSFFISETLQCGEITINPFVPNAPFLYPLKTSKNLTVF